MGDQRVKLIRKKNKCFAALWAADAEVRKCSLRQPVPASWQSRRAELVAEYSEALSAWLGYVASKDA